MMKKEWISTKEMLEVLKQEPDTEQEYRHHLGGMLRSTHWLKYSSQKNEFGDSTDWDSYIWFTEEEFQEFYDGHKWMRDG